MVPVEDTECVVCGSSRHDIEAQGFDYVYRSTPAEFTAVRCADCGHIYLNPRPRIEAIGIIYPPHYGTFVGKFSKKGSVVAILKDHVLLRRFRRGIGRLPSEGRVLDVGCGDGEFLRSLRAKNPDLELHGLDWHFPPKTRSVLEAEGIHLIEKPLEAAALPRDFFDVIAMNQIIEHLWTPGEALDKLKASLRQGGRILIETPNIDGYDRRWVRRSYWGGYYFPRHLNLFSRSGLTRLIEAHGLEVVDSWALAAPIIWIYSFGAWANSIGSKLAKKILGEPSILSLSVFTTVDLAAIAVGLTTSNQMVIAQKN